MVDSALPPSTPPSPDSPSEPGKDPLFQISKRKVLYVDLDEEIPSIFERIQRIPYTDVYLVVPERSILLQSIVNLQILKKKTAELHKNLSLITTDAAGIQLAYQAEIPVFDQYAGPSMPKTVKVVAEDGPLEPMNALRNEIENTGPERLTQKKVSIFDVVKEAKQRKGLPWTRLYNLWKERRERQRLNPSGASDGPSKKTLGTLVVASLAILFLISYIALPGATVTLTPKINVIEQSVNITLANANVYGTEPSFQGGHVLVSYPLTVTVEKNLTYNSTGQVFNGTNASGTVTLINERSTPWTLVAFTRLQTEEGLIFRTQEAVTVPAASNGGFGSVEVSVSADETDVYGRVIGERGNIGPSSFFLPGLREESQAVLYGRSTVDMAGGSTVVTLQITQEDLDASAALLESQLEAEAESTLEAEITSRNATNGTNLMLLTGYGSITLGEPVLSVPYSLVDSEQDSFDLSGTLTVSGYAFDRDAFLEVVRTALEERKSPDKILIKIDEDSLTSELFEVNETPGVIKFTATLKGIEAYDLNPETENGAALIKKIKEHIAGKPIKDAEDYIQNLPEINKVTISTWPIWAPTIPTVLDNINVKVDDAWLEEVETDTI